MGNPIIMTNKECDIARELSEIEIDQVSGGCGCGSNGKCAKQGSDGVFYNCDGMPLYGGTSFPKGTRP
jgi:hypothetical protein